MGKFCILAFGLSLVCPLQASWYWPFGSDDDDGSEAPRLSTLMEPATALIDEASDLAGDGKSAESVEKYREALAELDRIERENPERAATSEFATLRNKRAYVNAAIDSLLLGQVKSNAKAVAVSDTTELERKLAEEKGLKVSKFESLKDGKTGDESMQQEAPQTLKPSNPQTFKPLTKREQAMVDIAAGDFAAAEILINEMLAAKPNGVLGLNLKATMEVRQGKFKEAEQTLDRAIMNNPRNHFAYYNMALLLLQQNPDNRDSARRYYETGRTYGGPKDAELEALLK